MRKDEEITIASFSESGEMLKFAPIKNNAELAPLQDRYRPDGLKTWWKERSIPIGQGRIKEYLNRKGYSVPGEYLVKNLGLSLTDYYWIKPLDSDLKWGNINFFDNDFKESLLSGEEERENDKKGIPHYSPNGSLQGSIEKN